MEDRILLLKQENLMHNSNFLDKRWYRKLYGGVWYHLKFGKDTPWNGMFCLWTKVEPHNWEGYTEIIETESYPLTGCDTRIKLWKEFFKNILRKNVFISKF